MKAHPTGFQLTFLLFAMAFGAMLLTRQFASALQLPDAHFGTLGNLISYTLELSLILAIPVTRRLVLAGLRKPLDRQMRWEALGISGLKLAMTFGLTAATTLWALHVTGASADLVAQTFLPDRHEMDDHFFSTWGLVYAVLAVSIGPIAEEIIYRGALFRLWEQQWGWIAGALLSASVFSLIHPHNLIQTFLSAILYACIYRRTGTLWAPILCHAFYNFLVNWLLFGHLLRIRPQEFATSLQPWIPHLIGLAIGIVGFVLYVRLAAKTPART